MSELNRDYSIKEVEELARQLHDSGKDAELGVHNDRYIQAMLMAIWPGDLPRVDQVFINRLAEDYSRLLNSEADRV